MFSMWPYTGNISSNEVHESNPVNPFEDSWDPENLHRVQSPGGEQSNKDSQSTDWSLFFWLAR
jgi:hypothetical protein